MHPGIWKGKNVETLKQKVLILGESHYVSDFRDNHDALGKVSFTTRSIVEEYLKYHISNGRWSFFTKIAKTFGYNTEGEIRKFYDLVYFGNYVNVLVDKAGEQNGKYFIDKNKTIYNKELFDFCVNSSINVVVCFSKLVYDNLPNGGKNLNSQNENNMTIPWGKGTTSPEKWLYEKGYWENKFLILDNNLLVYGLPHTSRPYDVDLVYNEYIKKQPDLQWLCNVS